MDARGFEMGTVEADDIKHIRREFSDPEALISYAKSVLPRCLTPEQRKVYFLGAEPPHWCITGSNSEAKGNPDTWHGKWPYHTAEWKAWLIDVIKGEHVSLPKKPRGF
jgi:hypothetical protein